MTPFYRFAARGAIIPFLKMVSRQTVSGLENIPREGGFIAVANHLTDLDSLTAMRALVDADVPVYSLAKSTLFKVPVLGSILSLRLMERVPRRVMVITGYSSTAFFHVLIAGASMLLPADNAARPWILLVLIVCFVGAMQTCLNVSTWVIMSELFPLRVRAAGMGISAFSGWMMNGVLSLAFPVILGAVGLTGSFIGFAVVNVVIALLMFRNLPETRGVSLEQVERGVMDGSIYPSAGKR